MGKAVASGVQPTKCCVQPAGCAKADARPVPELWRRRGDPEQGRGAELSGYFSGYLHVFGFRTRVLSLLGGRALWTVLADPRQAARTLRSSRGTE